MRALLLTLLFLSALLSEGRMIEHRDFVEFYISTQLKEELKKELIEEMGLSIEKAKERLLEQIKEESERHRRLYIAQVEEFDHQLKSLGEEVEFLRELVVDANYQRNSNDDLVAQLQKQVRDLEDRLSDLQTLVDEDHEEAPDMPKGGQEL